MKVYLTHKAMDVLAIKSAMDGGTLNPSRDRYGMVELDDEVMAKLDEHRRPGESYSYTIIRLFDPAVPAIKLVYEGGSLRFPDTGVLLDENDDTTLEAYVTFNPQCFTPDGVFIPEVVHALAQLLRDVGALKGGEVTF